MKPKEILVFGATGQIGRHLIRKLTKNNYKVIAITRNSHQKGYILKTQSNPGYLDILELNIYDIEKLKKIIKNADICINLIGILYENKKNSFKNIHTDFPTIISEICNYYNLDRFIHVSSLGVDIALDSKYAKSKVQGEINILNNFSKSIILRPSLVYSVDDNFTTKFMSLLKFMPFFPLYYDGKTKFTPIHVTDFAEIIFQIIKKQIKNQYIDCIGPEVLSMKEIIQILMNSINKNRLLIPMPNSFAKFTATLLENLTSKPLLTKDQLVLLKYDNVSSGKFKTNFDLNINANLKFANQVEKYSYMWKDGGQFANKINKKI